MFGRFKNSEFGELFLLLGIDMIFATSDEQPASELLVVTIGH